MQTLLETVGLAALLVLSLAVVAALAAAMLWGRLRRWIGRRALDQQPDRLHLRPAAPRWRDAERVGEVAAILARHGFTDAGTFAVPELPRLGLALYLAADGRTAAAIYEQPPVGVWLDLWATTAVGDSVTATDCRKTGMLDRPPWDRQLRFPPGDVEAMLRTMAAERPADAVTFRADELPRRFEAEYGREIAWRKRRGIGEHEMEAIAAQMRGSP